MSNHFQNILTTTELKHAWANQSHFFCKSFTFLRQQKQLTLALSN